MPLDTPSTSVGPHLRTCYVILFLVNELIFI